MLDRNLIVNVTRDVQKVATLTTENVSDSLHVRTNVKETLDRLATIFSHMYKIKEYANFVMNGMNIYYVGHSYADKFVIEMEKFELVFDLDSDTFDGFTIQLRSYLIHDEEETANLDTDWLEFAAIIKKFFAIEVTTEWNEHTMSNYCEWICEQV